VSHYVIILLVVKRSKNASLVVYKILFHSFPVLKFIKGKEWIQKIHRDPGSEFIVTRILKYVNNNI